MNPFALVLCFTLVFTGMAVPVAGQEGKGAVAGREVKGITAYQEIIDLTTDDSVAVKTRITLTGWGEETVDLPLNFANAENIGVDAGDLKVTATAAKTGDVRVIKLQFGSKPPAEAKIGISYSTKKFFDWEKSKTPRGIYNLSYTFTNATSTNIGKYALQIFLPPGYAMNGVTSSTPRATGEEVESPYSFMTRDGRVEVSLRSPSVGSGKNAAIAFGFKKDEQNPWPLIGLGILISLVALYLKRDVLTRADYAQKVAA
jgi:hypothetical protein